MPGPLRRALSNPAIAFVARFALLLGVEVVAYPIATRRWFSAVEALVSATARIVYEILRLAGAEASRDGNLVRLGSFAVRIIEECTGIYEAIIFLAAVLAFPTGIGRKLVGIALGVPMLYAFNVARILALLAAGQQRAELFGFLHVYFWQATLILMILSTWLLWVVFVVRRAA